MRATLRGHGLWVGLVALGAVGCDGLIFTGAGRTDDVVPDPFGGVGGGGAAVDVGPSPDTPLRRLTRTEYVNTLRDLLFLGDTSAVEAAYPIEGVAEHFDNDAELLNVDDVIMERYEALAAIAVDQACAAGSASRARLITCDLAANGATCARDTLEAFVTRAWRRPVTSSELDELMASLEVAQQLGDGIEMGLRLALRRALVAADFLYRIELDPAGLVAIHPVSAHELATRLSYFLWSTMPDDELLAAAADGSLGTPDGLRRELRRMLADPKAEALVDNFGDQWLQSRALALPGVVKPDPTAFPMFDDDLRTSLVAESRAFFRSYLQSDRDIRGMLDADFTFANERLAAHYGLTGITGPALRQVSLAGTPRLGVLSQGSVLTVTSLPTRTAPTLRGKWVLSRLLCAPPKPAPANVPALEDHPADLPPDPTIRELLASHQKKGTACAGCHTSMDPIGFAMEHYDAVGRWRDAYPTRQIDATGKLPSGATFDGAAELSRVLKEDPRFVRCFAESVFAYAMGRQPRTLEDFTAVGRLDTALAERGSKAKELVTLVVQSDAFQLRRGEP